MCVIVVYSNPQTSRQAIAFLADAAVQQFAFDDMERDCLVRLLLRRPPTVPHDVKTCGEIVARFCAASGSCRRILLENLRPGFENESRGLLEAAARAVRAGGGAHFSDSELEEIGGFCRSQVRGRHPRKSRDPREYRFSVRSPSRRSGRSCCL
jgi:hypothetical protein